MASTRATGATAGPFFRAGDPTASRRGDGAARILLYSRAALVALAAALVISVVGASGADGVSGRLGGDFPAFFAAGEIVADGDWTELYDPDRQLAAQEELFGDTEGSFLYFAYPPHVAPLYRPLAALPYRAAYAVHTLVMLAALVVALALIRPMVDLVRNHFELTVTITILSYPMLRATTGGQNTALSLLALAAMWRLLSDDHDIAAGFVLALLLYKPQLALPFVGLLLVSRRWQAIGGFAAGAGAVWSFSASLMGTQWVTGWWAEVSAFASLDADINGHNAISWLGAAEGIFGSGTAGALLVGWPLAAATALAAAFVWSRNEVGLAPKMAVGVFAAIMVSPHAMFYDAGLLVIPCVIVADRLGHRAAVALAIAFTASWLHLGASAVGVAPLFFVIVGFGSWAVLTLARAEFFRRALTAAP
jgi:hypothetical protein